MGRLKRFGEWLRGTLSFLCSFALPFLVGAFDVNLRDSEDTARQIS